MTTLFPEIEPHASGHLDVGDGNHVYWETCGNPNGKPALIVHGGPGMGCVPNMRRSFDPAHYRIILFDQRGCGRSTPNASDPTTDMRHNTTHHLLADMERLRIHLGIDRWLLSAGSWGCTLALAYAERHPQHVSELVLMAVTTGQRSENTWLYRDTALFFPEAFQDFKNAVPVEDRDGDLINAYAKLMEHSDESIREQAARSWCTWEDEVLSLESNNKPNHYAERPSKDMLAFVRICTHYAANGAWLEEGEILKNASRLAGIPGVIIHGRRDLSCPAITAWQLAKAWPDAKLILLDDSGHLGSPSKRAALLAAHEQFNEA